MHPCKDATPLRIGMRAVACGVIAAWVGMACGVDTDLMDGTDEPIVVVGGYPLAFDDLAALAAADWYWAGDARTFFASAGPVVPVIPEGEESPASTSPLAVPGQVIRSLALGASLCPEDVAITPMTTATPCGPDGEPETIRGGVLLVFGRCELPSGIRLGGTVEITSTHTTDDAECDEDTIVHVEYSSTFSNVSWVTPAGVRVVVPTLQTTGRFDHRPGAPPDTVSVSSEGRLQRYLAAGDLDLDVEVTSEREIEVLPEIAGHVTSGTATVEDRLEGVTLRWASEEVRRVPDCCRPVDGRLVVTGMRAEVPGIEDAGDDEVTEVTETWEFGPTCGTALRNGEPDLLPGCP